jgi:hypothetical protein
MCYIFRDRRAYVSADDTAHCVLALAASQPDRKRTIAVYMSHVKLHQKALCTTVLRESSLEQEKKKKEV